MTKPIDWTRPLRVAGSHQIIERIVIKADGSILAFTPDDYLMELTLLGSVMRTDIGCTRAGISNGATVENIPPPPQIVERWTIVSNHSAGLLAETRHQIACTLAKWEEPFRSEARIARVLIEEPGE